MSSRKGEENIFPCRQSQLAKKTKEHLRDIRTKPSSQKLVVHRESFSFGVVEHLSSVTGRREFVMLASALVVLALFF